MIREIGAVLLGTEEEKSGVAPKIWDILSTIPHETDALI